MLCESVIQINNSARSSDTSFLDMKSLNLQFIMQSHFFCESILRDSFNPQKQMNRGDLQWVIPSCIWMNLHIESASIGRNAGHHLCAFYKQKRLLLWKHQTWWTELNKMIRWRGMWIWQLLNVKYKKKFWWQHHTGWS